MGLGQSGPGSCREGQRKDCGRLAARPWPPWERGHVYCHKSRPGCKSKQWSPGWAQKEWTLDAAIRVSCPSPPPPAAPPSLTAAPPLQWVGTNWGLPDRGGRGEQGTGGRPSYPKKELALGPPGKGVVSVTTHPWLPAPAGSEEARRRRNRRQTPNSDACC